MTRKGCVIVPIEMALLLSGSSFMNCATWRVGHCPYQWCAIPIPELESEFWGFPGLWNFYCQLNQFSTCFAFLFHSTSTFQCNPSSMDSLDWFNNFFVRVYISLPSQISVDWKMCSLFLWPVTLLSLQGGGVSLWYFSLGLRGGPLENFRVNRLILVSHHPNSTRVFC